MQKVIGLRERNRRDTWNALHEAAAALAFDEGPADVTVDAIVARAGVSKRTFFNYFATKDDAILGYREATLAPEAIAAFVDGPGDLLERTVRLVVAAFRSSTLPEHVDGRRLALVRRHPELRARMDAHAATIEALVAPHIAAELGVDAAEVSIHPPAGARAGSRRTDGGKRAAALLMLAGTIVRFAYKTDLAAMAAGDDAAIDAAIAPFRDLLRSIDD